MPPSSPLESVDQVYILAAIWTETIFYGFYTCLFLLALYVLGKSSVSKCSHRNSKIFLAALILMFVTASVHESVALYTLIQAFGFLNGPDGTAISYFSRTPRWDGNFSMILLGFMTWVGDALVIYRCYIVWGHNLLIIVLPILLFIATLCVNITIYIWFANPFAPFSPIHRLIDTAWPLLFAQNVLTTGLIAYKIIQHHRRSNVSVLGHDSATTVSLGSAPRPTEASSIQKGSLLGVVRIIVESALLYTLEVLVVIILHFANHPLRFVVQAAIVPSIGIVFTLIAIRVQAARVRASTQLGRAVAPSVIPAWLTDASLPELRGEGTSSISEDRYSLPVLGAGVNPGRRDAEIFVQRETLVCRNGSSVSVELGGGVSG